MKNIEGYTCKNQLELSYDPTQTTQSAISKLLAQAKLMGKAEPLAQYLLGAMLEFRFPEEKISNERYNADDAQARRLGDFEIGDAVFHVTVAPSINVYEKCKQNIEKGYRVFLIVPEESVVGARQNAESTVPGKIAVESLEYFVANILEFYSSFDKNQLVKGICRLLELYNSRVESIEPDKSLLIKIPHTLE